MCVSAGIGVRPVWSRHHLPTAVRQRAARHGHHPASVRELHDCIFTEELIAVIRIVVDLFVS